MAKRSSRRVVITGCGVVSPLGNSPEALWSALSSGTSGVARLKGVPDDFLPIDGAGECREFTSDIADFGELDKQIKRAVKKNLRVGCRDIHMGVAAANHAMNQAGVTPGNFDPDRTGCVFGSDYMMTVPHEFIDSVRLCSNGSRTFDFTRWGDEGIKKVDPLWLLKYLPNMPACHLAIFNDLRGPNNSLTVREASANIAIAEAARTIERGHADIMVTGSTGTRVHPARSIHMALQEQMASGDDPTRLSRPFDKDRNGMVIGEGAAAFVLQDLDSAQAAGKEIFGEIIGFGSSSASGRNTVANFKQALGNVLRQCLTTAKLSADDIGHVHAHGLSTLKCDAEEAAAINDVFAGRGSPVPVVAAKSYFGNLGAGAGAVEALASCLAVKQGRLFGTLNYETPDEVCDISVVTDGATSAGDCFVSINVTPQGQASGIVIRKAG